MNISTLDTLYQAFENAQNAWRELNRHDARRGGLADIHAATDSANIGYVTLADIAKRLSIIVDGNKGKFEYIMPSQGDLIEFLQQEATE